ncbi:MAG: hypothetical protein HKN04_13835 [Rhodothermaceae bacterium]|nr:hypothetical protein [Rhodothermaceae bacterium]
MPDPYDTLSIFAQVALALAGFSGIVVALGHRSVGELTPLEARRLVNLFTFSGLVFILTLLGISLLHIEHVDTSFLWRNGSAVLVLTGIPWMILDWHKIHRLSPEERSKIRGIIIYPSTVIAIFALLLQLVNIFILGVAWPFFVALVAQLAFTFQQFILLVWSGLRDH